MRVTSDFFVSALVRRVFAAGGFAAVASRGATEAGAVFLVVRDRVGTATLYGPAPQVSYGDGPVEDRLFARLASAEGPEIDARLDRERRFDSDIWIVELEPAEGDVTALVRIVE